MSREDHSKKIPAAALQEEQDPNTRVYFDNYASPELRAELSRLRFEEAAKTRGPDVELTSSTPSQKVGANTSTPMGSSYPVSLHVLLDADPGARAFLERQPEDVQQAVMAANLQTAGELENYVKKLENRLEGRPDGGTENTAVKS